MSTPELRRALASEIDRLDAEIEILQNAIARALKLKPAAKKAPHLSADDFLPASSMRGE